MTTFQRLTGPQNVVQCQIPTAIPENREFIKWKFSFFHQRHALSTSFDIFVVTRVINFFAKTHPHAIIFDGKN